MKFDEGQTSVRVTIAIEGNGFLAVGTTFTAALKAVDYLEAGGIIKTFNIFMFNINIISNRTVSNKTKTKSLYI